MGDRARRRALRAWVAASSTQIRDAVWVWDPLGIGDDRAAAPDEYDGLVTALVGSAARGAPDEDIRRHLAGWPTGADEVVAVVRRVALARPGTSPGQLGPGGPVG